jgi:hypothetical protein
VRELLMVEGVLLLVGAATEHVPVLLAHLHSMYQVQDTSAPVPAPCTSSLYQVYSL